MSMDKLGKELADTLVEDGYRETVHGEYHPSTISGCSLKAFLDRMADVETTLNSWLFQGSAVHYYLQEDGLMTEALNRAGYHPVHTSYEVRTTHEVTDDILIVGTCDIYCSDDEQETIFDIKYSSIPPESGHGRIYKYYSQANTYAHMFGADAYGLIMISSKSRELARDIHVLEGELSEENWEVVQEKAKSIHSALEKYGWPEGSRIPIGVLEEKDNSFWKEVMKDFDKSRIPSYEKECKYCDHKDYCPVENGKLGGVKSLIND